MYRKAALASVLLAALVAGRPAASHYDNDNDHQKYADTYYFYTGDGSIRDGWPSEDAWSSWDDLWNVNVPLMQGSCSWNGWGANNSADEIDSISYAIQELANETGVDRRFILAIMMQESRGCVRAPTTYNGVTNPGLMQSHNGAGTCANTNPCPSWQVTQMIRDGVTGTPSGDGLQHTLDQACGAMGRTDSRSFYAAARLYNSGSIDYSDMNNGLGSTACYVSDVANRLTGWAFAPSNCQA